MYLLAPPMILNALAAALGAGAVACKAVSKEG